MIKVVEAISDMNIGGAGRLLLSRVAKADKNKFSYTIILPKGSVLVSHFKKMGVKTIELKGCQNKSLDLISFFKFYKAIKAIAPNVLNSHACMNARIAGKFAGIKVNLYTRHCDFPVRKIYNLSIVKCMVKAFTSFLNDGIIAVSDSARKNLLHLGIEDSQVKVIINGAEKMRALSTEEKNDLKRKLNIPKEAIVVSIFARLESYKDHKTFLRAAKRLVPFDKYCFLIVGNGSCEYELKKYVNELGIEENVRFLGFVEDVSPIMNITDINVNCSIGTETSCLALSEGMSLGIPAVASDYEGNLYIVKDLINGLIFPQRDDFALSEKILDLTSDKKLYFYLSQNAKQRFEKELNAERMTADTERYYIEMLKKKTARNKKQTVKGFL